MQNIFITGGTGYIGSRLLKALKEEGNYQVRALVRKGSEPKVPPGCEIIKGNALDASTYQDQIEPDSIFIHLIGVAHPSPSKKEQFKKIDLVSIREAVQAAKRANVRHFIYLGVAQFPSGIMKEYQKVRAEGEELLLQSKIPCSFVRPWYVLGPGHWWPIILIPLYFLAKLFPYTKERAERQGLVTIKQMSATLMLAVKNADSQNHVFEVEHIRISKSRKL